MRKVPWGPGRLPGQEQEPGLQGPFLQEREKMRSVCSHRVSMQPPQEETHGVRGLQGRSTDAAFSLSYGQEVFYHFTVLQTAPAPHQLQSFEALAFCFAVLWFDFAHFLCNVDIFKSNRHKPVLFPCGMVGPA